MKAPRLKPFQRKVNLDAPPSVRQQRFIEEYLVDLNATKAVGRAGYATKRPVETGRKLMKLPWILKAIGEAMATRSSRTAVDQDWVITRLREISDRCMQAVPVFDKAGEPIMGQNANGETVPAYTFDSGGANRSTELLGKHLGMFRDRVELAGPNGGPLSYVLYGEREKATTDEWQAHNPPPP